MFQAELFPETSTLPHVDDVVVESSLIYFGSGDQTGSFSSPTVASAAPKVLMKGNIYCTSPLHALH